LINSFLGFFYCIHPVKINLVPDYSLAKIVNFTAFMASLQEYTMGMDFTAKTFAGLEDVLAAELKNIGVSDIQVIKRGVQFRGEKEDMYKANYLCRTALRVLRPIGVFEVSDDVQLYEKVKKINWQEVFRLDQTFNINAHVFYSQLDHEQYVALRTKDAIVDQFREATGKRPWVAKEDADVYIDVHISQDVCTISLDSSGESLHKRGYRIDADKAPINEVLAAGMIKLTDWRGDKDFYDPMCGSATIPIEAAMLAMNIPAAYYRKHFSFMNWADYDEALFKKIKEEADLEMGELDCHIFASDRSEKAVGIAKRNLRNAGLHKDIDVRVSYFDNIQPENKGGILVFNPPYGKRMEERGEIRDLYSGIGDVLKQNFSGFEAWIITSNMDVAKFIGLRPSAKIVLYNGPLESRFIKFELYEGSKKAKNNPQWEEKREYGNRDSQREDKEDYRKRKVKNTAGKFSRNDERKKPDREYDKPKWKDKGDRSSTDNKDSSYSRRPTLGKPEKTQYTGDGKRGSRKKRPRIND